MPISFRSKPLKKKLRTALPGNLGEIFSRGKAFYLLYSFLTGIEVHQLRIHWVSEAFSSRVKRPLTSICVELYPHTSPGLDT
jgi:hypothetical protein